MQWYSTGQSIPNYVINLYVMDAAHTGNSNMYTSQETESKRVTTEYTKCKRAVLAQT